MLVRKHLLFLTWIPLAASLALAQNIYTPAAGSPERRGIMDAARIPIEAKLKKHVVFKVDRLKVENGWAFMIATPQTPDGRLAYGGTEYEQGLKEGIVSGEVCVLLHWIRDRWRVVTYSIGPTDVVYENWDRKYGAPPAIFK
ncbi:MAG TPA: hypothetical protein VI756_11205 [Blastocatellia bacterium]